MRKIKYVCFLGFLLMLVMISFPYNSAVNATELSTPREETLVLDVISYEVTQWSSFNSFTWNNEFLNGWAQIGHEWDWYKVARGEPKLWRITGWEYDDDYTTFTMFIRNDVHWSDGHAYTSRDIAFTINMVMNQTSWFGSDVYSEWIESVETPDDYTLIVHLKKPNSRFADTFGMWMSGACSYWWPWVVPEHIWKDVDPNNFTDYPPLGTGPYTLKEANPTLKYFLWERDENYWAKDQFPEFEESPKYVMIKVAGPIDIQMAEFVSGGSDLVRPTPGYGILRFLPEKSSTINLVSAPSEGGASGLAVNTGKYPFTLRDFRWALSYCIDRERISRLNPDAPPGYTLPVTSGVPCGYSTPAAASPELQRYADVIEENNRIIEDEYGWTIDYDLTKAREILDSLDFIDRDGDGVRETPNGTKLSFELLADVPTNVWEYTVIMEDFEKVGIHLELVSEVDFWWNIYVYPGDYDLHLSLVSFGGGTTFDIAKTLETYHSVRGAGGYACWGQPEQGGSHWSNPRYDEIVDEMSGFSPDDYETIDPLAEEALYLLGLDMPQIPIRQIKAEIFAVNTAYWKGWPALPNYYTEIRCWYASFFYPILNLRPATSVELTYLTVFAITDIPKFNAVDGEIHGPFVNKEVTTLPKQDCERLILEGKASYTAPVTPEVSAIADAATKNRAAMDAVDILIHRLNSIVASLPDSVEGVEGVEALEAVEALDEKINTMTGKINTMTNVAIVEGIAIVVLAVVTVLLRRKPT